LKAAVGGSSTAATTWTLHASLYNDTQTTFTDSSFLFAKLWDLSFYYWDYFLNFNVFGILGFFEKLNFWFWLKLVMQID